MCKELLNTSYSYNLLLLFLESLLLILIMYPVITYCIARFLLLLRLHEDVLSQKPQLSKLQKRKYNDRVSEKMYCSLSCPQYYVWQKKEKKKVYTAE